ncbi:MAG: hypothetical protein JWM87_333 [Candidatus Eremiobacteraeota bacterium]|nr:hypothetical protein [Candidatus Eremiobacteraeota bacterium]
MRVPSPEPVAGTTVPYLNAVLFVVAAGVLPGVMFFAVSVNGAMVPWADEWDWLGPTNALRHGAWTYIDVYMQHVSLLQTLWGQHNEHRPFLPGVLAVALSLLGGWSPKREELVDVAVATLELALLWRMLRATVRAEMRPAVLLAASLLVFSFAQFENWTWGFQMGWFLAVAFALATVYLVTQRTVTPLHLVVAWGAAVGSAYSLATGLLCPLLGFAILLVRRDVPLRTSLLWLGGSLVAFGVYFYGYSFAREPGAHLETWNQLARYPVYVLLYLGALAGSWNGAAFTVFCGLAGLCVYFVSLARYAVLARARSAYEANYLPWLGLGTFCVLNALVTSYGRIGWGPESAVQSRYTTVTAMFWVSVVALAAVLYEDARPRLAFLPRLVRRAPAALAAVCFAAVMWQSDVRGYAMMSATHAAMDRGTRALERLGTASDAELYDLFPPDARVPRVGIKLMALAGVGPLAHAPQLAFAGRADEPAFGAVDVFAYLHDARETKVAAAVPTGAPVIVRGWICDLATLQPGESVRALVDGKESPAAVRYGLATPDVARGFFLASLANVGFEMKIDTTNLPRGAHVLGVALTTRANPNLHRLARTKLAFRLAE